MIRRILGVGLVSVLFSAIVAAGGAPASADLSGDDYAPFSGRVTDSKGVVTDVVDFGFATGLNVLTAHRGDAEVDIPFRLVRTLEVGALVPEKGRAQGTVTLRSGKSIPIELDESEEDRLMAGDADFGSYRIRLAKVRRIEIAVPAPRVAQ